MPIDRKPDVDTRALDAVLRRAFGGAPTSYERTADGVSTQVYRVVRGSETFYLRIAEEVDDNLETDAELFRQLRNLGVRVSEIIYVSAFEADLNRSVAVTTEVPGGPVTGLIPPVLEAAGADLARINQIPVDGFGWIRRNGPRWPMLASFDSYEPFLTSELPSPWPGALASLFPSSAIDAIEVVIAAELRVAPTHGRLAHGDFDTTPIFCVGTDYTGLIDFGEIRGTEPMFDLGHFHLHDPSGTLMPALIRGYEQVTPLPADHMDAIRRSAIMLGLRQLCRWFGPVRGYVAEHPLVVGRAGRLQELLLRS